MSSRKKGEYSSKEDKRIKSTLFATNGLDCFLANRFVRRNDWKHHIAQFRKLHIISSASRDGLFRHTSIKNFEISAHERAHGRCHKWVMLLFGREKFLDVREVSKFWIWNCQSLWKVVLFGGKSVRTSVWNCLIVLWISKNSFEVKTTQSWFDCLASACH